MPFFSYFLQYNRYLNIIGIGVILLIAYLFSKKRSAINYRLVVTALMMQFVVAFFVLNTGIGHSLVQTVADGVTRLYLFAEEGIQFVFGGLADASGPWGFVFAIKVLPIIIFFGALMSLLFHLGVVQKCVAGISYIMRPLLGTSGSETLCAISNSFLGQTEAPLLVRNYLKGMTKSEMYLVMVSGMATISGAILAVYAAMGIPAPHLLTASVMSIPGSIMIAKIIYPETKQSETAAGATPTFETPSKNAIDAISSGTTDGMYLAFNVGAMLISFISLIALINFSFGSVSLFLNKGLSLIGIGWQMPELTLNYIFSIIFAPFGYLLGFTGTQALQAAQVIGTKITINELVAYGELLAMNVSPRMLNILTYALCGFSNFSCIGIQVGGIGALVPEKRQWLCELGLYAVLGGALSNLLSAMIASLFI